MVGLGWPPDWVPACAPVDPMMLMNVDLRGDMGGITAAVEIHLTGPNSPGRACPCRYKISTEAPASANLWWTPPTEPR